MKKEEQIYNNVEYIRVTKPIAKKAYNFDMSVLVLPLKVRFDNMWVKPTDITEYNKNNEEKQSFEKMMNGYEAYNCNQEFGTYSKYYIKKADFDRLQNKFAIIDYNRGQLPSTIKEAIEYTGMTKKELTEHFKIHKDGIIKINRDCYIFGICLTEYYTFLKDKICEN
jgi:hypothetical protein